MKLRQPPWDKIRPTTVLQPRGTGLLLQMPARRDPKPSIPLHQVTDPFSQKRQGAHLPPSPRPQPNQDLWIIYEIWQHLQPQEPDVWFLETSFNAEPYELNGRTKLAMSIQMLTVN